MIKSKIKLVLLLLWVTRCAFSQEMEVLYIHQAYDRIIESCTPPSTEQEYFWLAQALDQKGKSLDAIHILETLPDSSLTPSLQHLKGNLYFKTGQYHKAQPYLIDNSKDNAAFLKLMATYEASDDYMIVIDSITHRLTTDSLNLDLLNILANAYYRSEAEVMAISTYKKIYSINPEDLSTANKLALLLLNSRKEGNIQQSVRIANEVLKNDSTNKRFLRIKGRSHYILEDYHRALPCFKQLYDSGYTGVSNCKYLGICEFKTFNYEEARTHLLKAEVKEPDDIQTTLFLAKTHLELNDIAAALNCYQKIDTLLLPSDELMISLLWDKQRCYRVLERYDHVDFYLKQLTQYDQKPDYYFYIASNYQEGLKNLTKALEYYELYIEKTASPKEMVISKDLRAIAMDRITKVKEELFMQVVPKKNE